MYQSVHTEKWQQTKQNNTSGSDYLLGGQATRTTKNQYDPAHHLLSLII